MANNTDETLFNGPDELDDLFDLNNISLSPLRADILEGLNLGLDQNPTFSQNSQQLFSPFDNSNQTDSSQFSENSFNDPKISNVFPINGSADNTETNNSRLEIIAHPNFGNKLRYRGEYMKNECRLGALKNDNKNSSYQGPAIRIPKMYLSNLGEFFVRLTLITIKYDKTDRYYIHPYELENPVQKHFNQTNINSVYFPIENEDCIAGIKSFPTLRITKKTAPELKAHGNLHVYDCGHLSSTPSFTTPQLSNAKDTISEFNLDQSMIAFTIVRQYVVNNQTQLDVYVDSTVFSHVMIEGKSKEAEGEQDTQLRNEEPIVSTPPPCRIYKYAPRYGFDTSEEDMVIFLTHKLETKKYGDLQVSFECNTPRGRWIEVIPKDKLDIKDRMVVFKTPTFVQSTEKIQPVDITLKQEHRSIDIIKYFYLSTKNPCFKCQFDELPRSIETIPNSQTKRPINDDYQLDSFETEHNNLPSVESLPEKSIKDISSTSQFSDQIAEILDTCIENIFIDNDFSEFYRLCRGKLRSTPVLLHNAIEKNHLNVLIQFIAVSLNDILQKQNSNGETVLLHAIRLNRIEVVQAILKRSKSQELLTDIDNEHNNIFHLIALHCKSLEIFDLLIKYLEQNTISIQNKFDHLNKNHFTPLQLSISKNNQLIMKVYLKYFRRDVCRTEGFTGDNLIHLAVRYSDLNMIKYLIENENFNQLANQSNMKSTPKQLAQLLKRDDIVEYLENKFPEQILKDTDSSSDDENT